MKFSFVTIHVSDLEKSIEFYEAVLGLSVLNRFAAGPETEIAFMGDEGAELELIGDGGGEKCNYDNHITMGFDTPSLEASMEMLKTKNIPILRGPIQPNPNTRFFYIEDPDGFVLQFVER